MTFAQRLLRRPRSTLLWKLNFQVHLWIGLLLTLYLIVIGVTGSLLVFRVELERLAGQRPTVAASPAKPPLRLEQVLSRLQSGYPHIRVLSLLSPTADEPFFVATVLGRSERSTARLDPFTGAFAGRVNTRRSWVDFVADLHMTLLLGRKGRVANGVGAALLLVLNITGLVIWWNGSKVWKRGFTIDWRRSWRRVNFDLHRAAGFWTLSIVSIWAISGVYFGWPTQFIGAIDRLSPLVSALPPAVPVRPVVQVTQQEPAAMIAQAYKLDPGTTLAGINFPYSRRAPFEILMERPGGTGSAYTDTLYFNPWDGTHLKTWRYGVNESLGDWLLWLQAPLHFGTSWGLGVKIIWAALGMAIPLLAVTGALLYWNRVLRHKKIGGVPGRRKT